ncbi:MAG: hypothetical protein WBB23_23420 [Desulforhopalus sp.]
MKNQMAALLNDASLTPLQAAETAQKEADDLLAPYVAKLPWLYLDFESLRNN